MPETKYGTLGVTVPVKTDKPIAIPTYFKNFADSFGAEQTKGKLLVAQNAGAAAWEAIKGDATLAEDGSMTLAAARKPVTWYTPKVIAPEESRENAAFGTLATKDEIPGVVVPENGLILVGYTARVKSSVANAGRVAIFLGANQVKLPSLAVQEAITGGGLEELGRIVSSGGGLVPMADGAEAATGQILGEPSSRGGFVLLTAAAGTYAVSVQYRATSGKVTSLQRKLWVAVLGF